MATLSSTSWLCLMQTTCLTPLSTNTLPICSEWQAARTTTSGFFEALCSNECISDDFTSSPSPALTSPFSSRRQLSFLLDVSRPWHDMWRILGVSYSMADKLSFVATFERNLIALPDPCMADMMAFFSVWKSSWSKVFSIPPSRNISGDANRKPTSRISYDFACCSCLLR